jgi:hypothetical protein
LTAIISTGKEESLPVPKLLKWRQHIPQHYQVDKPILLTSGCSFTASTAQLAAAASWPGFVLERCGFDHCVDYSYPGAGNEYIGDSILCHLSTLSESEIKKYMVIVMWSGIDRIGKKIVNSPNPLPNTPVLNGISYIRDTAATKEDIKKTAQQSADKIFEMYDFLTSRSIPFVFSYYCNLLYPPYIPKRDSTPEFDKCLDVETVKKLRDLPWIPKNPMDFMFEFGFKNDLLGDDLFHPTMKGSEYWTDQILLPEMLNQNLISKL